MYLARSRSEIGLHDASWPSPNMTYGPPFCTDSTCPASDLKNAVGRTMLCEMSPHACRSSSNFSFAACLDNIYQLFFRRHIAIMQNCYRNDGGNVAGSDAVSILVRALKWNDRTFRPRVTVSQSHGKAPLAIAVIWVGLTIAEAKRRLRRL